MIGQLVWYSFVSFFAIYGLVQIIFYVFDFCYDFKILNHKVLYTIVGVKNEEEKVEGIAKALLWKSLRNDSGVADNKVVIVDLGSTDGTKEIIKRMEHEQKGILVMEKTEFLEDLEKSI